MRFPSQGEYNSTQLTKPLDINRIPLEYTFIRPRKNTIPRKSLKQNLQLFIGLAFQNVPVHLNFDYQFDVPSVLVVVHVCGCVCVVSSVIYCVHDSPP